MLGPKVRVLVMTMILPLMAANTDVVCALGTGAASYNPATDERPSQDTMQIVQRVDAAFKPICLPRCPQAAMLRNATAANLMLLVNNEGAKIVYTPPFFAGVYAKFGDAGLVALIAHVYGHAIDEVTQSTWLPAKWNPELRADAWAGCVLAKTSLPPSGVTSALGALAANPPPSQAGWGPRLPAVRLGFTHCGGDAAKFDSAGSGVKAK